MFIEQQLNFGEKLAPTLLLILGECETLLIVLETKDTLAYVCLHRFPWGYKYHSLIICTSNMQVKLGHVHRALFQG